MRTANQGFGILDSMALRPDIKARLLKETPMKTAAMLILLLGSWQLASAQQAVQVEPRFQAQTKPSREKPLLFTEPGPGLKPNEYKRGKKTYKGIAVHAARSKNPLQLINPFAPKEYGSGWDNVSRDVTTGQITGLNFFSVIWDWQPEKDR